MELHVHTSLEHSIREWAVAKLQQAFTQAEFDYWAGLKQYLSGKLPDILTDEPLEFDWSKLMDYNLDAEELSSIDRIAFSQELQQLQAQLIAPSTAKTIAVEEVTTPEFLPSPSLTKPDKLLRPNLSSDILSGPSHSISTASEGTVDFSVEVTPASAENIGISMIPSGSVPPVALVPSTLEQEHPMSVRSGGNNILRALQCYNSYLARCFAHSRNVDEAVDNLPRLLFSQYIIELSHQLPELQEFLQQTTVDKLLDDNLEIGGRTLEGLGLIELIKILTKYLETSQRWLDSLDHLPIEAFFPYVSYCLREKYVYQVGEYDVPCNPWKVDYANVAIPEQYLSEHIKLRAIKAKGQRLSSYLRSMAQNDANYIPLDMDASALRGEFAKSLVQILTYDQDFMEALDKIGDGTQDPEYMCQQVQKLHHDSPYAGQWYEKCIHRLGEEVLHSRSAEVAVLDKEYEITRGLRLFYGQMSDFVREFFQFHAERSQRKRSQQESQGSTDDVQSSMTNLNVLLAQYCRHKLHHQDLDDSQRDFLLTVQYAVAGTTKHPVSKPDIPPLEENSANLLQQFVQDVKTQNVQIWLEGDKKSYGVEETDLGTKLRQVQEKMTEHYCDLVDIAKIEAVAVSDQGAPANAVTTGRALSPIATPIWEPQPTNAGKNFY